MVSSGCKHKNTLAEKTVQNKKKYVEQNKNHLVIGPLWTNLY